MRLIRYFHSLLFLLALPVAGAAQTGGKSLLQSRIQAIIDTSGAKIGVGLLGLDFSYSLLTNGAQHFPMQSVFKLPLAITILAMADAGSLSLEQRIPIRRKSLDTATWSPLLKELPARDTALSVADLLRYTVSKSDNNTCDILFGLAGGTAAVDSHMRSIGISGISIKATEAEMKTGWPVQYTNWSTPASMLQLLRMVYEGRLLSAGSNAFLIKILTESENPPNRIKGRLPAGTIVAHKTGTSDADQEGMRAATNDVGIITLPDGRRYALVVFVSDYRGGVPRGERIIAGISRLVWDCLASH